MLQNAHLASSSVLFWLLILIAAGIIFIGTRFIVAPLRAAQDFGVPAGASEGSTYMWAKGTRDIVSGLLALGLLWLRVNPDVLAMFVFIASLIPLGDLLNVYAHNPAKMYAAFFIHGGTALFMWLVAIFLLRA